MNKRPLCSTEGCNNLALRRYRRLDGSSCYRKLCTKCTRKKYNQTNVGSKSRRLASMSFTVCSSCGWDKGPCDRHRIKPNGKYEPKNVVSLCPNCHRLVHLNLLKITK